MGVRLIVEVLDHAPADLTPAERLVLVVIAESANDSTREGWPDVETIARRTGLAPESLTNVFRRLARHGVEVRVPIKVADNGRPVFACNGRQKTYRIPPLNCSPVSSSTLGSPVEEPGLKTGPETGLEDVDRSVDIRRPVRGPVKTGPRTGPSPQQPSENPQQRGGPADDDRAEVLAEIRRRKPGATEALIRHVYREDGPAILAEIRERTVKQRITDWIDNLATMPPCPHGFPGGDQIRPDTGKPQCALCRALHRRTAA